MQKFFSIWIIFGVIIGSPISGAILYLELHTAWSNRVKLYPQVKMKGDIIILKYLAYENSLDVCKHF